MRLLPNVSAVSTRESSAQPYYGLASQLYDNLRFYPAENPHILFYGKMTPAKDNIILVVVNLDFDRTREPLAAERTGFVRDANAPPLEA